MITKNGVPQKWAKKTGVSQKIAIKWQLHKDKKKKEKCIPEVNEQKGRCATKLILKETDVWKKNVSQKIMKKKTRVAKKTTKLTDISKKKKKSVSQKLLNKKTGDPQK